MPNDTYFSLDFPQWNPKDVGKECKKKKPDGSIVVVPPDGPADLQNFLDALNNGTLEFLGSIYRGRLNTATGALLTDAQALSTASGSPTPCVIVYVGGTAYRICT